ncbi:MAG: hypothetical protein ABJF23_02895 [Bryobacteraceae bacterium]
MSRYADARPVMFDNPGAGASISEIMDGVHSSHEQVVAVIEFAAR